jgi:hypothetical protein
LFSFFLLFLSQYFIGLLITTTTIPIFFHLFFILHFWIKFITYFFVFFHFLILIGYRKTDLRPNEIIIEVKTPFPPKNTYIKAMHLKRRREDDIAIVTCCFSVGFDSNNKINQFGSAFGGIGPTTVRYIASDTTSKKEKKLSTSLTDYLRMLFDFLKKRKKTFRLLYFFSYFVLLLARKFFFSFF